MSSHTGETVCCGSQVGTAHAETFPREADTRALRLMDEGDARSCPMCGTKAEKLPTQEGKCHQTVLGTGTDCKHRSVVEHYQQKAARLLLCRTAIARTRVPQPLPQRVTATPLLPSAGTDTADAPCRTVRRCCTKLHGHRSISRFRINQKETRTTCN